MNENEYFLYLNTGLPTQIERRKQAGDLEGALRLIEKRLDKGGLPVALEASLKLQREVIRRTPDDYPYTGEEAIAIIRKHIPDFTGEEFSERLDNGEILWAYINGEMRILDSFFDTLCKADPLFAARAHVKQHGVESVVKEEGEGRLDRVARLMRENGSLSNRIRIRASIKVKDECFTPGMKVRVHLPVPAACEQQTDIVFEKLYPENGFVAPETALQRTVYWEETMAENHEFSVEYSYTHTAVYHDTEKMTADREQPSFFLEEEQPHIVFTPGVRALAKELTAGVESPIEKARRIYDYITLNMKYRFMPHYFILPCIPDAAIKNNYGDCGIFAITFITLCRAAGVPAKWQSGLTAEPDYCGCHDWAMFYAAPYGWLYADPSYGTAAVRAKNETRRKFYFGNLDAYRMAANSAFGAPLVPDKKFFRIMRFDNQCGEIETDTRGLADTEVKTTHEVLSLKEILPNVQMPQ